ncbi:MAG: OmpH family outer membrane protein [Hydrogenobacter sp.]|uniref:OmpH family outer membrane protein n=1 Tax=Hydrogenobacter thermophilus TaxID=940 RepID=UPI0030F6D3E7
MKKLILSSLLLSSFSLAEQKFACVDPNRILSESKSVSQAQEQLKKKVQDYQKQLDEKQKKLDELKKQIESKGISQKAKEEKIKEYQKVEAEGMELQQKAQKDIMELKSKLEEDILNKVRGIAEGIAKKNGYTGILDCSAFVYKQPDIDITDAIIKSLDQGK